MESNPFPDSARNYLVIGAGCFGASTAYHLKQTFPTSTVTILDRAPFPNPSAASHDLNKIIRSDYQDIFYMRLALEAQELWRQDPIYKSYYHESGMLYVDDKGSGRKNLENLNALGISHHAEIRNAEDTRAQFDGVFRDANWEGVPSTYFNPQSGWGEADRALENLITAAVKAGVKYDSSGVSTLSIDEEETCLGVRTDDGQELLADKIILCTGAWTPKLLLNSAPHWSELHAGERIIAAGAIQCSASYPPDQMYKLRSVPVVFNGCDHTEGESIPPTPGKLLKFNYEASFTNQTHHDRSEQDISIPPVRVEQTTWSQAVPQGLKDEIGNVVKNIYGGRIEGLKIEEYRMCWDAVTPTQDWIVDEHPHCKNLFIAGGGSFHAWKFMPTIGKYVVQRIQGTLEKEMAQRWAWDRPSVGDGANASYKPRRDLKDIRGYDEIAKHLVKV